MMFLCFTAFFLFMHLLNWSDNYYLRGFNGVIEVVGLWLALRAWMREHPQEHDNYAGGVAFGMATTMVGVLPFTVFMIIFLAYNPAFMARIQEQMPIGDYFNPITASLFILVEGIAAGVIVSYILMRMLESLKRPV
jgi:hypothetical protein